MDSLTPAVEKAVGLKFTHKPMSAVRSRDQVRSYVLHKLDEELPTAKARGLQAAYRLLGMFPDSLELRPLLLDLYTEQIVGFYEPDSSTLFVAANADPKFLTVVVAHELVHALQHQYVPLDSIMRQASDNDRLSAATAILEGQATLGGLQVMVPEQNLYAMPEFWETYRDNLRSQQASMPVFSKAPRIPQGERRLPLPGGRRLSAMVGRLRAARHDALRAPDADIDRAGAASLSLRPGRRAGHPGVRSAG